MLTNKEIDKLTAPIYELIQINSEKQITDNWTEEYVRNKKELHCVNYEF